MPNLIVEHPPQANAPALDGALSVGRGADNDVVIDHPTVSRHHAVIERIAGEYFLTDLGSRNGTRVNGRSAHERKPIAHGAEAPGEALRRQARELIDGIPAIDLPSAIAFLEFLRERGSQALAADSSEDAARTATG